MEFAKAIGMVPIELHKEKAGYVLNSLLVPFLAAAAELAPGGYADPPDVDKTWGIAPGAPVGPFQIYDIVGLTTPYNIFAHGDADAQKLAAWLKESSSTRASRPGVRRGLLQVLLIAPPRA